MKRLCNIHAAFEVYYCFGSEFRVQRRGGSGVERVTVACGAQRGPEGRERPVGRERELGARRAFLEGQHVDSIEQRWRRIECGKLLGLRHPGDFRLVVVAGESEVEPARAVRDERCVDDQVHTGRFRVDAVDEEPSARHADESQRLQVGPHVVLREVLRQHDAVVDVDAIAVHRDAEHADAPHGAQREIDGLLGIEICRAQRLRDRVCHGKGRDVERHAIDEVRRRRREELLLQRGRAETVLHGAAQGEGLREVVTTRDLAGHVAAEVRVVFGAHGDRAEELIGEIGFEIEIRADGRAIFIDGVRGAKSRKYLSAGLRGRAVG